MKDLMRKLAEYCCVSLSSDFSEAGLRELFEQHGYLPNADFDYNAHMLAGGDEFFHNACLNERVSEGVLRCLLEYFPGAAIIRSTSSGETPLHCICSNKNATLGMVKLLIDAAPESVQREDYFGKTPLHCLCCN